MVQAISSFTDFCYLARRSILDEDTLDTMDHALAEFHTHREFFREAGVRPTGFSLPRQHSLTHYRQLVEAFGAPNGLCSSITESFHIKAVKEPWRRSNRHEPLGQMLVTNQRLDKLAAFRIYLGTHTAPSPQGSLEPEPDSQGNREELQDLDIGIDNEVVHGPRTRGFILLAQRPGVSCLSF